MKRAGRYQRPTSAAPKYIPLARQQQKARQATDRKQKRHRLYGRAWSKYRAGFLAKADNALCVACKALGRVVASAEVDHIVPHCGDHVLFWDASNHQPLCKSCHSRKTATNDGGFGNRGGAGHSA